jgi:hypothetical protein
MTVLVGAVRCELWGRSADQRTQSGIRALPTIRGAQPSPAQWRLTQGRGTCTSHTTTRGAAVNTRLMCKSRLAFQEPRPHSEREGVRRVMVDRPDQEHSSINGVTEHIVKEKIR